MRHIHALRFLKMLAPITICAPLLVISGCAEERLPPLEPADSARSFGITDYVIAPSDTVHIVVYDEPDLTNDYLVLPEGNIQVPLVGILPAKGMTAEQLATSLSDRLRGRILAQPRVSVNLVQLRPVFVSGSVNKPGAYPYVADMTVEMAVALAGGYLDRAAESRVVIKHPGERERQFRLDPNSPIKLAPGDLVKVPERLF